MNAITSSVFPISQGVHTPAVVPLFQRVIESDSLIPNVESLNPARQPFRKTGRVNRQIVVELEQVSQEDRNLINKAFELISNALDDNIYPSERSNSFDEWKDLLTYISRHVNNLSNNHRKILGSLIASTMSEDISDFPSANGLRILHEATNALRRPRITKTECNRTISDLLNCGTDIMIPLSVEENSKQEQKLDELMANLLKKARY